MLFKTNLKWLDQPTSITIDQKLAEKLSLIPKQKDPLECNLEIVFSDVKKHKDKQIISYKILNAQSNKERRIQLNTESLTAWEYFLLGIACIYKVKPNTSQGKDFLERSITYYIDSCLPYYVLKKENMCKHDDICSSWIKRALKMDDIFPDFFITLARKEMNFLRRNHIIELAYKKFPNDPNILDMYSEMLFLKKDYNACINILEKVIELCKNAEDNFFKSHIFEKLYNCYVHTKNYKGLGKLIKTTHLIEKEDLLFFSGIFYHNHKINYKKSAGYFKKAIVEEMRDSELTVTSIIFMMSCYIEMEDSDKLLATIDLLPTDFQITDHFYIIPYTSFELVNPLIQILEKSLPLVKNVKKNAAVSGFLGMFYEYQITNNRISSKQKITDTQNKCMQLLKKSLKNNKKSLPLNLAYSNILYHTEKYDDAMIASLHCFEGDEYSSWNPTQVKLSNCSSSFLQKYPSTLSEHLDTMSDIEKYINGSLSEDINYLSANKNYDIIVEIYKTFSNYIQDIKFTDPELFSFMNDGVGFIFNIAYALHEKKIIEDALKMYLLYIKYEKSASAYNNIAIIYEEKNDIENAKKYIEKALKMSYEDDDMTVRNHKRITENTDNNNVSKPQKSSAKIEKEEKRKSIMPFSINEKKPCINIERHRIKISKNTKLFYCLRALFNVEDLYDEIYFSEIAENIDQVNPPSDKNVYNWIDQIKKKITLSTGIKDVFTTSARSLSINKKYLKKS